MGAGLPNGLVRRPMAVQGKRGHAVCPRPICLHWIFNHVIAARRILRPAWLRTGERALSPARVFKLVGSCFGVDDDSDAGLLVMLFVARSETYVLFLSHPICMRISMPHREYRCVPQKNQNSYTDDKEPARQLHDGQSIIR